MKMKSKKFIGIIFAILLMSLPLLMGIPSGCPDRSQQGRTFEVDGWTLFQFNRSNTPRSRLVNLVSLDDPSLIENGVLTIPTRVGRHNINGFGAGGPYWLRFNPGQGVEKIVVPAGISISHNFWDMRRYIQAPRTLPYIELLCDTFELINPLGGGGHVPFTIIIPDGSTQNLLDRFYELGTSTDRYTFIEKSLWQQTQIKENINQ